MSALTRAPRTGRGRLVAVIGLLAILSVGLAACRGFFGQAPIAILWIDNGGDTEAPVTVTFDISDSADPDGEIASFDLDFGDGSAHETGDDVSVLITHEYTDEGTYQVVLTVTDNDGRIGMTNKTVTIGPVMIAFAANRLADYDIYRMKADGTEEAAVRNTADDELFPDLVRITRDKIAFSAEDGTSWNIWTMTVEGLSPTQLTTQTASNQIQPSWSADASMIAYASNAAQTPSSTTWEIYTMAADGTAQTKLTSQSPSWAIAPAYSPVNDDILFVSDKTATGGSSIWLWDDGLSAAVELYDGPGRDGDASPALAGLGTALDLPPGAGISRPVWSPDGEHIAFSAERTAGGIIDIYIYDVDAATAKTLEDYIDDEFGAPNPNITTDEDEYCPYWLEDDSGIVFVRDDGAGDIQIYKVEFATGTVTQLTETGSNISPAAER